MEAVQVCVGQSGGKRRRIQPTDAWQGEFLFSAALTSVPKAATGNRVRAIDAAGNGGVEECGCDHDGEVGFTRIDLLFCTLRRHHFSNSTSK